MDTKDWVLFDRNDSIAVVTLNKPDSLNSITWPLLEDIEKIQNAIEEDPSIRVVVIKGNGKHFSSGVSLETLKSSDAQYMMHKLDWIQRVWSNWQRLPIPVIAAVQGACIGGATEMILACDIRIAADNARFRLPEVSLGISPDMGGTTRLTKLVGLGQAKRMIMASEEINAQEALRIGLVEVVVAAQDLETKVMGMAQKMAGMSPIGMRWAKKGINLASESSVANGLLYEQAQSICCFMTGDIQEGISSIIEKRKPVFKGK